MALSLQDIMTPAAVTAVHQSQRAAQRKKAVAFLRKTFAASTAHVDDKSLDQMVRLAHDRVDEGQLRSERDVFKHLIGMMMLGAHFQADPVHRGLIQKRIATDGVMPRLGTHTILTHTDDWVVWSQIDAPDHAVLADRIENLADALPETLASGQVEQALVSSNPRRAAVLRHHGLLGDVVQSQIEDLSTVCSDGPTLFAAMAMSLHLGRGFRTNPLYAPHLPQITVTTLTTCLRAIYPSYQRQDITDV